MPGVTLPPRASRDKEMTVNVPGNGLDMRVATDLAEALAMIAGVGIDLLAVARMEGELSDPEASFISEVFTESEIAYCQSMRYPARHFAARFAAKEAALKALGGVGNVLPRWRDVEIVTGECGAPEMRLEGRFREAAARKRVDAIHLSLAHTAEHAAATVIMECRAEGSRSEVNE